MPDEVPEKAMWERQRNEARILSKVLSVPPKDLKERNWSFQMHYIQTFKIESDNHFLKAVVALLYAFTMRIVDLYLYLETI